KSDPPANAELCTDSRYNDQALRVTTLINTWGTAGPSVFGKTRAGSVENQMLPIDPHSYPEWDLQVSTHSAGSFFHLQEWASVLKQTYGHRAAYFCRFAGGEMTGLLPVMEVSS